MRSLVSLAARLGCPAPEEFLFHKAIIDSREAVPGALFFALAGSRADGHRFVPEVLGAGGAAVVSEGGFTGNVLEVDSVEGALLEAGAWAREPMGCPVVGVTGSSGKTTTRKMLAQALSVKFNTAQTKGNLNNHLGVPLTLLNTPDDAEFLVLEMGMNHHGELLKLGWAAKPDHALITNIGRAHMEFFESIEGIAHAKAEMLETTAPGGIAVLPAGEEILLKVAGEKELEIITHGEDGDCWLDGMYGMPWGIRLELGYAGCHNMMNAVSAIAFAERMGIEPRDAFNAIAALNPSDGRGARFLWRNRTVFDESYNANPDSTAACLRAVAAESREPLAAVLGDMLEMGNRAVDYHKEILMSASEEGYEHLILVGKNYAQAAKDISLPSVILAEDWQEALELLKANVPDKCRILVKGSHSTGLEKLVAQIRKEGV
ncbi:hypothetical protein CSA37_10465 [Candidatus Fermentibacteria bacterium]|nr:MAG: hypothetical protein CSA37_10465 [Candidatus Fermentibacteria bacterium]